MSYRRLAKVITVMFLGLFAAGCSRSKPARFYVLAPLSRSEVSKEKTLADRSDVIGIGPVELPEYIDRPQMVIRLSDQRLELAEFDRWAEPLKASFPRTVAENLSTLLSTEGVVNLPSKSVTALSHRIAVEVIRFDGSPGESATLIARWTILNAEGKDIVPLTRSEYIVETQAPGFEGLAKAMSKAVADLCREIATAMAAVI